MRCTGSSFCTRIWGLLDNRSFGGSQVSRTFYARGQTGQQLLLGAYSALNRQINLGKVKMYTRTEMLDVVMIDGHAKGIVTRSLITGAIDTIAHMPFYSVQAVMVTYSIYPQMLWVQMLPLRGVP